MIRTLDMRAALVVAALAAAVVAAPIASAAVVVGPSTGDAATAQNASEAPDLSSGASLSGALSVHRTDLEGSVDRRALERDLADADGPEARATLLSDRRLDVERRIETLESRRAELRVERRDGTLSPSAYRVRAATLTAETRRLRRLLASVERESRGLPDPVREAYGIDDDGLNRSLARVETATGPSFDATFAAVVGEDPPEESGNYTRASINEETRLALGRTMATREAVAALLVRLETRGVDETVLECTRANVSAADEALTSVATGVDWAGGATAEAALVDARTDLRRAHVCLQGIEGNWTAEEWNDYEWNGSDTEPGWNGSDYEYEETDYEYHGKDYQDEEKDYERDGYNWTEDGSTSEFESRDADR